MNAPKVGDPVVFVPDAFVSIERQNPCEADRVRGRVIYVNEQRGFFTVEGDCNGYRIRESYSLRGKRGNVRVL